MKANVAPEKIYLTEDNPAKEWYRTKQVGFDSIEYTRTDTFIEKSVNFLEMLGNGFTIIDNITHTNYDKEQLVKDFRNYMKGE